MTSSRVHQPPPSSRLLLDFWDDHSGRGDADVRPCADGPALDLPAPIARLRSPARIRVDFAPDDVLDGAGNANIGRLRSPSRRA